MFAGFYYLFFLSWKIIIKKSFVIIVMMIIIIVIIIKNIVLSLTADDEGLITLSLFECLSEKGINVDLIS